MKDSDLRKALLNGRKTRINFAATSEPKAAASKLAEERCITVSSLIVNLLVEKPLRNKDVIEEAVR